MSETRADLREALARELADVILDGGAISPRALADRLLSGPLAQVSALQAEVEAARALNRDLHRRVQKAESFRARHGNTYGVKARWAGRQALRKALAEVERLQKDKRELAMEHVARDLGDESHFEAVQKMGAEIASLRERLQKVEGERAAARDDLEAVDALATEWCQGRAYRSSGSEDARDGYVRGATSVAGEVRRLIHARDPEFHNRIAARQAPSDNPLTETKEGSDAR